MISCALRSVISIICSSLSKSTSLPETKYRALSSNVEITRDKIGIPHIKASNLWDMYFAQGVIIAHDRLWQMDLMRRVASGRLSEIFGKNAVAKDIIQREIRLSHIAKQKKEDLDELDTKITSAFLDGINSYIDKIPRWKLPLEFQMLNYEPEYFSVEDVLANGLMKVWMNISWPADYVRHQVYRKMPKNMASLLFMDGTRDYTPHSDPKHFADEEAYQKLMTEIEEAFRDKQEALDLLGLGDPDTGSATFAISGKRTESGKPLLAVDNHQGFVAPNFFYPIHLCCPEYNVAGISLPLLPGIFMGHNKKIAWGSIVFLADNQDIFIEELSDDKEHYLYKGKMRPLDITNEEIKIKGGKKTIRLKTYATHHGLILKSKGKYALAIANLAQHIKSYDIAMYRVGISENFEQFKKALLASTNIPFETTFIDSNNNIGYVVSGLVPIRNNHDGSFPVFGRDGKYEWNGFVQLEELPWACNNEDNFFNCANHKNNYLGNNFLYSSRWHPIFRGERTSELIQQKEKHTVESLLRIQADQLSLHARFLIPYVINKIKDITDNPYLNDIIEHLKTWDYVLSPDSFEATIYNELSETIKRNLFISFIGNQLFSEYIKVWPSVSISVEYILKNEIYGFIEGRYENYQELCRYSLNQSLKKLEKIFKTSKYRNWKWGKIHRLVFKHPLGKNRILAPFFNHECAIGGDGEVIFTARSTGDRETRMQNFSKNNNQYLAIFGSCIRCVYDSNNWDNTHFVLNLGLSGNRFSGRYKNYFKSWINNQLTPFIYSEEAIKRNSIDTVILEPEVGLKNAEVCDLSGGELCGRG